MTTSDIATGGRLTTPTRRWNGLSHGNSKMFDFMIQGFISYIQHLKHFESLYICPANGGALQCCAKKEAKIEEKTPILLVSDPPYS